MTIILTVNDLPHGSIGQRIAMKHKWVFDLFVKDVGNIQYGSEELGEVWRFYYLGFKRGIGYQDTCLDET